MLFRQIRSVVGLTFFYFFIFYFFIFYFFIFYFFIFLTTLLGYLQETYKIRKRQNRMHDLSPNGSARTGANSHASFDKNVHWRCGTHAWMLHCGLINLHYKLPVWLENLSTARDKILIRIVNFPPHSEPKPLLPSCPSMSAPLSIAWVTST